MVTIDQEVLKLDLKNLSPEQIQWLHNLKAEAFKKSLSADFARMKQERIAVQ